MTEISYRWQPIKDLPESYKELESPELHTLAQVWNEQKDQLTQLDSLKDFNQQLRRKWAIETGIIEQIYTLDRGVTQLLIERGIDANLIPYGASDRPPEMVTLIIRDHEAAVETLFDYVKNDRPVSTSAIKELHSLLTRHQETSSAINSIGRSLEVPLLHGEWKRTSNNPTRPDGSIHEYCPPEHVAAEMDRLIEFHFEHLKKDVSPEVEAAWLHHRFTQIHPFQDGNGRVVRCLASLIFLKAGWFSLVVTREERRDYIDALEEADDKDNLRPLLGLFQRLQRKAFVEALGVAGDIQRRERVVQVIDSAVDHLRTRQEALRREWDEAKNLAERLSEMAKARLNELSTDIQAGFKTISTEYGNRIDFESDNGSRRHYFRWQIVQTAKTLDYFANIGVYHGWIRLILKTDSQSEILISFHGLGKEFRGILGCSACFYRREESEEGQHAVHEVFPACKELFQFNYKETIQQTSERFRLWLDEVEMLGVELWRTSLN